LCGFGGGRVLITKAMTDDAVLIRRYLDGSEAAFAELVRCHIGAVYGTALRIVAGDAHLADDVTQKVFTNLARKAQSLADRPVLVGWLYLSTQYQAAKAVRSEQRWREREKKAQVMTEIENQGAPEPDWSALRPVIDSALRSLKENDRDALLLRFFQSRTFAEVGEALGLSENAARMRVDRALDKLHGQLVRRGIKSTATAIGTIMAGQLATAAPATLTATVTTAALAGAATASGATIIFMGMTKLQVAVAVALVVAGGSTLLSERHKESQLFAENTTLAEQTAQIPVLRIENAKLEANARRTEILRQEASSVVDLRAEEARLKDALGKAVATRNAQMAARGVTSGGSSSDLLNQIPTPLERVAPRYPAEMKILGIPGETKLSFIVGKDGSVHNVETVESTNDAFTEMAKSALAKWKFKPGQKNGIVVNARMVVPFVFSINDDATPDWF